MHQRSERTRRSAGIRSSDPGASAVEVRGFEPLTFSMPWRRATNCAIPPLARSILPRWGRQNKSGEGDARHSRGSVARTPEIPRHRRSDEGPDQAEIANDVAVAHLADALVSRIRTQPGVISARVPLAAHLGAGCRSACPPDELHSGAQRPAAGPGEWKCGCHNDSSDFYGRRDLQMGRGYRRKGQRQEFWKETPRPVRNPNENIFETTMCLRMKHASYAEKRCWSATAVPDVGEGPVSEYRLSSSAVGAAGSDAKAA